MTTKKLRRELKQAIDRMPPDELASRADYAAFLSRPPLARRIELAEKEFASSKGTNWRKVRRSA